MVFACTAVPLHHSYHGLWTPAQTRIFVLNALLHDHSELVQELVPHVLPASAIPVEVICGALQFTDCQALHRLMCKCPSPLQVFMPRCNGSGSGLSMAKVYGWVIKKTVPRDYNPLHTGGRLVCHFGVLCRTA